MKLTIEVEGQEIIALSDLLAKEIQERKDHIEYMKDFKTDSDIEEYLGEASRAMATLENIYDKIQKKQ